MTIRRDEYGNLRGPDPYSKRGIKRIQHKSWRIRRALGVRRDRRARVLLTRSRYEL